MQIREGRWTPEEHELFLQGLEEFPHRCWKKISAIVGTRTVVQVRTHAQKYFLSLSKAESINDTQQRHLDQLSASSRSSSMNPSTKIVEDIKKPRIPKRTRNMCKEEQQKVKTTKKKKFKPLQVVNIVEDIQIDVNEPTSSDEVDEYWDNISLPIDIGILDDFVFGGLSCASSNHEVFSVEDFMATNWLDA